MSSTRLKLFLGGSNSGILTQPTNTSNERAINRHILRKLGGTTSSNKSVTPFRIVFNASETNKRYVYDSSDYIRFKRLQANKRTYN